MNLSNLGLIGQTVMVGLEQATPATLSTILILTCTLTQFPNKLIYEK